MTTDYQIASSLDSLSREGSRWLWKSRLRDGLNRHLPRALWLLFLVPVFALLILGLGWLFAQPWKFSAGGLIVLWPLPSLGYLTWHFRPLFQQQPTRREGLAVFDKQYRLKDRLQTADEFLAMTEQSRTPFMEAAVLDSEHAVEVAFQRGLDWEWGEAWIRNLSRLAGIPLLALVLLVVALFLPEASRRASASSEGAAGATTEPPAKTTLLPKQEPRSTSPKATIHSQTREPAVVPEEKRRKTSKGAPVPSKKSENPSPELSGREKISIGDSEGGQTSQATSSGRSSQSRGTPGNQSPASTPDKNPPKPKKKTKPKEPKDEKDSPRKKKKTEEKSGATAGRGSSSGSSRNPASTDWSSKDRTEETDNEEFEQEEDVDDDESESEARGGLQPSLRDRRPPVNRDLSIGFGNRSNPDANGRGGPGQRKKSRGVASLVLGVPVPDHVKGQPNPGRVKINQERVQPQREEAPAAEAEDRGARSGPAGAVLERTLDSAMRRVVRDYFLKIRESASPGKEPAGGD